MNASPAPAPTSAPTSPQAAPVRPLIMAAAVGGPVALMAGFLETSLRGAGTSASSLLFLSGLTLLSVAAVAERRRLREALAHRSSVLGLNNVVLILTVGLICVVVNLFAANLSERVAILGKLDMTRDAFYTLSPDSTKVLTGVADPVTVLAFFVAPRGAGSDEVGVRRQRAQIKTLLDLYGAACPLITWRFVDPEAEPATAERYAVRLPGTLVLERGEDRIVIKPWSIFQPSDPIRGLRAAFLGEQAVTNALRRLLDAKQPTVYFTLGHGEHDLNVPGPEGMTRLAEAIMRDHYRLLGLNLLSAGRVPADASALVLAGPTRDLAPQEETLLKDFLTGGGNVLLLVDERPPASLARLVAPLGVVLRDNFIVDMQSSFFNRPTWPIPTLNGHRITDELIRYHRMPTLAGAGALGCNQDVRAYMIRTVAQTSRQSWAETDFTQARPRYDAGIDEMGPVSVALAVTSDTSRPDSQAARETNEFRLVVVGDSDFVTNRAIDMQANADFFLNALAWVTRLADRFSIRPKEMQAEKIPLTDGQGSAVFYAFSLGLPLLYGLVGLATWFRRSHR